MTRKLRIVLLSEVFGKGMGYLENLLPKYFGRIGADVHVLTTDLPLDYRSQNTDSVYKGFVPELNVRGDEAQDGFRLHVLEHVNVGGHMRMAGLREKLRSLAPDIVQTMTPIGWLALDAGLSKLTLGYSLFTGCHYHSSVFPLAHQNLHFWSKELLQCFLLRTLPGSLVALTTEKCYAISPDCAEIAVEFFGVPRTKVEVCPLGVDTDHFHLPRDVSEERTRRELRCRLGFRDSEIVCIYTGRLSAEKNPLLLARAVAQLSSNGQPFRGLFVGKGEQSNEIGRCSGCLIHPFVPAEELAKFYHASDVGVWPTQESMSMMDAAACGLPIVANHTMTAKERIEGNGLTYSLNDLSDLVRILKELREPATRQGLVVSARARSHEILVGKQSREGACAITKNLFECPDRQRTATETLAA